MSWIGQIRSLGRALLDVLQAEWEALQAEIAESGGHLGRALGFLAVAAVLLFWMVGALIFSLGAVLAIWLPVWGAALLATALFALATGILAALGMRHLRRFQSPARTVRRRLGEHFGWWGSRLLGELEQREERE
jgi:hypothetical protein